MHNERHSIRPLIFLCVMALVSVVVWASQATLHEIVKGSGRIVSQTRTQPVQHLEGGIIQDIFVKEGDVVKAGDPLFMVNSLVTNSEYNELMITRLFTQIKIQRLIAEQQGEADFTFDVDTSIANAEQFFLSQKEIFQARQNELESHVKVLDEKINQKSFYIDKLVKELENRNEELNVSKKQLKIDQRLLDKGVISESKFLQTRSHLTGLETEVQMVRDEIPVSKAELKEAKENKNQIREAFLSSVSDELSQEKVKFQQIEERLNKLKDRLNRATVVSPSAGTVNRIFVNTPGQVIQSGDTLLELAPSGGKVLVEGRLRAEDRGRTWIGQNAIIRVSAYDFSKYGSIDGAVEDISADSFVDDYGNTFYRVKIGLDEASIPQSDAYKILPGMTVEFHIKAGVKTVLQMLLSPVLEELWFGFSMLQNKT